MSSYRVLALVSGGKDSCYNALLCEQQGHELVALGNLYPSDECVEELDSYMYQTVGHQLIEAYAECTGLPLLRKRIVGSSVEQGLIYSGKGRGGNGSASAARDEVEDLEVLLKYAQDRYDIEAVSSGAIASDYQRSRVERVCSKLKLVSLAYMWHQPQSQLMREMIVHGIDARLIKVAAAGLDPERHLGKSLRQMEGPLHKLRRLYGINVCGEGGEYETLTLDCPLFRRGRIVVDESEVVVAVADSLAPVAWMRVVKFHVEKKDVGTDGLVEVIQVPDAYGGAEEEEADGVPDVQERDHDIVVEVPARSGDTTAQTFHAHCNTSDGFDAMLYALRRGMHEHGWCMDTDCVFVTLFVDDMARFGAVNEVYSRHFPPVNPPSRATLEKSTRGISIQVLCSSRPRSVLHVQSLSRWAPSCIGPYSQAVACDGLVRYSGQIALEPETLTIACNDLDAEVARVSRTCDLLGQAMKLDWASTVLWSVLYVSDRFPADVLRRLLNRHEDESEDVEEDIGDSNAYDDHGTSYIEEYLKGTKNDKVVVRPEVMTLIVECPCLPRNARIEIQSVHAGIESLTYMDPDSSSDEEEQTAQLAAMTEYGWLRHLTYDESSTPIFRIRAAYAPGKLAKIHMISLVSESDALKEGTVGGGDLMDAIAPILQAAAFTTADITAVNGYVAGAGREILQDTLHAALGVPAFVVQVSGVALFGQGQGEENSPARFAIELLFSK